MRTIRTAALATTLALLLALPTLIAAPASTWRAFGSYEPDTKLDESGGRMWLFPNQERIDRVYLNVVASTPVPASPNVGLVGSRMPPPAGVAFEAFFGVWIDCNKDGYVGHVETVALEYRDELLLDKSLCPPAPAGSADGHNQQGWVSELRWIRSHISPNNFCGGDANGDGTCDGRDKRVLVDPGALVWGDIGLPGDATRASTCPAIDPVFGLPRGTLQRTGALLSYADCYDNRLMFDLVSGPLATTGLGYDEAHAADRDFDQPGHPLNQPTLGEAHPRHAFVRAFDCSQEPQPVGTGVRGLQTPEEEVNDEISTPYVMLTDEEGNVAVQPRYRDGGLYGFPVVSPRARGPGAPTVNPEGNVAGTAAAATDDATGDCDPSNGGGLDAYLLEGDVAVERSRTKSQPSAIFSYYEGQRSGNQQRGNPLDAGVYPLARNQNVLQSVAGTRWSYAPSPEVHGPLPPLVRADTLEAEGGGYWTFYATLTTALLGSVELPSPDAFWAYGAEWCGAGSTGVVGGFQCDPTLWYVGADGEPVGGTGNLPRPGTPYVLRDVDCYDMSPARGAPATVGPAWLAEGGLCEDSDVV